VALGYLRVTIPDLFEPGRYGLASAINWVPGGDPHWQAGVQYDTDCTEVAVTIMECISGAPSPIPGKVPTWSRGTRGAHPFTVYEEVDCTPDVDWWEVGSQKALRALNNSGPMQLERTFQTGSVQVTGGAGPLNYPNLNSIGPIFASDGRILLQPASTIISGSPLDIVEGLGALETAFGLCYDGLGVVHMPIRMAAEMCARNLVYKDGNVLRTWLGNKVVIGSGYDFTKGPGNATAPGGSGWMWMTGPIFGYKAAPVVFDRTTQFDRSTNTYKVRAEQTYLLGWQCCLVAVLVTTGGEQAGDPGTPLQDT